MVLEVLAAIDDMIATWNRKDPEALAAMFAADADFTDALGHTAVGRPAIAAQYQRPFAGPLRYATLTADHVAARTLGADAVVARLSWTLAGARGPDDLALPALRGTMQVVLLRGDARWHIASILNQIPAPTHPA